MTMIDNKEKLALFHRLLHAGMANCDLRLLEEQKPDASGLNRFRINPERYAGDILFALIDVASEQLILDNRKAVNQIQLTKAVAPAMGKTVAKAKPTQESPAPTEAKKKPSRKKRNILRFIGMTFLT